MRFLRFGNNLQSGLLLLLVGLAITTGSAMGRSFDLDAIREYAWKNSPQLKMVKEVINAEQGEKEVARSPLLPAISTGVNYTRYKIEHGIIEGAFGDSQEPGHERLAWDITFNYIAFSFGKDYFAYKAASQLVKSRTKDFTRAWQNLSFQLAKIYYSIITVDKTIDATRATIKSLETLVREIGEKVKVGRLPEVDLLKVEVTLSRSTDDLSKLETLKEDLLGELAKLMGYNEPGRLVIKEQPMEEIEEKHFNVNELLEEAYSERADLKSIEHSLESVRYQTKSVKASYLPEIALRGAYSKQASGDADFVSDGNVAVMISMPIFDGFLRKGKIDKLKAEENRLRFALQDKRLQIAKEVKTALKDYQETLTRIRSARRSVKHAEEVLRIEKLKYKLGRTTINFVLEAESALLTAKSIFYKAYHDNYVALEKIKLALGRQQLKQ
ncbi:MAG: TolC family protein [Deltaproteobacteria bacterium]|nr:TolC family protein [Deltaproteobacteria bacterium]MBW2067746.1 TolC family protein [Deltaproteobacteria bacterium]